MMKKGFNLIELMVVIAIIAILASISYGIYVRKAAQSRTKAAYTCLGSVATAMENYFTNNGQYPDENDFAAIGYQNNDCGDSNIYEFSWTLGPDNQYYRIQVSDTITSVYGGYAYGNDVWVLCSHNSEPLNITSPDDLNPVDADRLCW